MAKKICLVTGASSGIGKEIALALAKTGAHVIMVCRNTDKGNCALKDIKQQSGSTSIDLLTADLSSQSEIRLLSKMIYERYSNLHVLINNAGVVLSKKTLSADGIEMTLATNHLGPFLLTHLLLDLLKKSAPSRIINISSNIHKWAKVDLTDLQYGRRPYKFMQAYAQSKLLVNIATFALSKKLIGTGVTANCAHPGAVKTNLGTDSASSLTLKFIDKCIKFFFITPQKAAESLCYLAVAPEIATSSGKYFMKGKPSLASATSYDNVLSDKICDISKQLVGISMGS